MYKTFEYRIFTNRSQHARLLSTLAESRRLYNEMLKAHYEESGKFLGSYDLAYHFKGRGGEHVPQTTVQALADRLDKALKRFTQGIRSQSWLSALQERQPLALYTASPIR